MSSWIEVAIYLIVLLLLDITRIVHVFTFISLCLDDNIFVETGMSLPRKDCEWYRNSTDNFITFC